MMKVHGLWTAVGAALGLIALYLVLTNAFGATSVFGSLASGTSGIFKTLQGR